MCLATALDKAFENIDCMIAILCCQAKNRFYESTQRLIQPRRVLCSMRPFSVRTTMTALVNINELHHRFWEQRQTKINGNFRPEWGYLAPADSFIRTARIVFVAT